MGCSEGKSSLDPVWPREPNQQSQIVPWWHGALLGLLGQHLTGERDFPGTDYLFTTLFLTATQVFNRMILRLRFADKVYVCWGSYACFMVEPKWFISLLSCRFGPKVHITFLILRRRHQYYVTAKTASSCLKSTPLQECVHTWHTEAQTHQMFPLNENMSLCHNRREGIHFNSESGFLICVIVSLMTDCVTFIVIANNCECKEPNDL